MNPALLCLVGLSSLTAVPEGVPSHDGLCRAAQRLAQGQKDLPGRALELRATWEWREGTGEPAVNSAGIVAMALARSTGCVDPAALARYATARLAQHSAYEFLFDGDVEALAEAARVLGDAHLLQVAREAFARRYEGATGEEVFERWLWMRRQNPALVGFDAAQAIRAAVAVGAREKALEIADAAGKGRKHWAEGKDALGFHTTARGAMLEALALLDANRYAALGRDLMHHLLLTQSSDGSWNRRVTQATAYAVRGLARWNDEAAHAGAAHGRLWLQATQLADGGWASFNDRLPPPFVGDRIPEITAETLLALTP